MHHHEPIDPATTRHRRLFAALRIAEVSLGVLGAMTFVLVLTRPVSPGHTNLALYFMAWSTPRIFVATGAILLAAAGLLQVVSRPLKRRWARQLRGWIN
jgi:hypothetical protein